MGAPPVTPSQPHANGVGILHMDVAGNSLPRERSPNPARARGRVISTEYRVPSTKRTLPHSVLGTRYSLRALHRKLQVHRPNPFPLAVGTFRGLLIDQFGG